MATVDILIPNYNRPAALAITIASLISQTYRDFCVVISDQTEDFDSGLIAEVTAVLRALRSHGQPIEIHKHLPRLGMAEHRQFLLDQVTAPYALFLDDDLILESYVVQQMLTAIQEEGCGFVGSASGLSFIEDVRTHEQAIEF
ncbi:glycosyltransferase family 2 protein [Phormidesmis priestleyi]|uniref:glycosyltransferase family 2 protein n=1 Tax=Phormidesmis priestleyi TaxID=268141 RepID=UPI000933650F|nr:glycosyltransferase family A protein [Phormidesmis priestleyi]